MKITRLQAEQVHGYLALDVPFFDQLTFLTGLNGSGKTTVLRLLMALLTPNIDELGAISFTKAIVTIQDGTIQISVTAEKTSDGIILAISETAEVLFINSADLELLLDVRRREEPGSPIAYKYQQNAIFQRIKAISTPMFLGLDRRFYAPGLIGEDPMETRKREYLSRRMSVEDPALRGSATAALAEVNILVAGRLQEVRAAQEQLDERLRAEFFAKAFEYKPAEIQQKTAGLPSRAEIEKYRKQLATIELRAGGARIPVPEIQQALSKFFERMGQIVSSMEKTVHRPTKPSKKKSAKVGAQESAHSIAIAHLEWIINKPQADRIVQHLDMLESFLESRDSLHDPINRFLSLLNGFLKQTGKTVSLAKNGQLSVSIGTQEIPRSIAALSSGERQLLVMLAHLSLNPHLAVSGVFIVDEPELSLHIDWQERFVDAVTEANPKVQLILATHSPAIILDRTEACCPLPVNDAS